MKLTMDLRNFATILIFLWTMEEFLIDGKSDCEYGVSNSVVMLDGTCYNCPDGLFGTNCSQTCPIGYYGTYCLSECNCDRKHFCHPVLGCVRLDTNGSLIACGSSLTNGKGNVTTDDGVACTDIHYYGLTIFQWFLLSALMMGINFLLLIITCAMCACRKGSNEKDFNSHQVLGALATLVDGRYHHHALNAHAQMGTLENNLYTETNTQNHHTHNNANYTLPRPSVTVHDESNCANSYPQNSSGSFTCHNGETRVPCAGNSNTLQYDEPNYDMIDERHTQHADWRKRPMRENFKHVGTRISQFFSNTYLSLEAKFPSRSRSPAPESVACDDQTCKDNAQPVDVVDNTYFMLEKTNNQEEEEEEEADINIESESLDEF